MEGASTPTPAPTASPTATPAETAAPTPENRHYSGQQQSEYIKTAVNAFVEARGVKYSAFVAANRAYQEAGGASVKGLDSKEAITARRSLIQTASQTNDEYLAFVETQDATYRAELAKTPLVKEDVEALVTEYATNSKEATVKKLREVQRDLLRTGDAMMDFLEKKYGGWKVTANKISFKKAADTNAFSAMGKKYNTYVDEITKLSEEVNASSPTPSTSPIPSASPSPSGAAVPAETASAPTPSPAPGAKPKS